MDIRIGDYHLGSDSYNITLSAVMVSQGKTKKGETYLDPIGYYSSVSNALSALIDHKIKRSTATTLKQLIEDVREAKKLVADALADAGLPVKK